MLNNDVQLLHAAVAAVCPIDGVSLNAPSFAKDAVRLDFNVAATPKQRADALAVVAAFDPVTAQLSFDAIAAQMKINEAKNLSLRDRGVILAVAEVVGIDGAALIAKVKSHINAEGAKV